MEKTIKMNDLTTIFDARAMVGVLSSSWLILAENVDIISKVIVSLLTIIYLAYGIYAKHREHNKTMKE